MRNMSKLFNPTSIAVIGGGAWGRNIIDQCIKIGFKGEIWPIHPREENLSGFSVYRSVSNLPAAPDACFVGINRYATIPVVAELSAIGAGGAVCFASGYLEAQSEIQDGADLQAQLVAAAGNMPILGPNCYGFINYLDQVCLWPDQHGGHPCDSGVAIITQSSNIAINLTMQRRGLPIAMVMTAGNQAQTSQAEIGMSVLSDPRVTALGLHIEGIRSVREFEELANHARRLGKGIVALKVGASEQAQAATISHTASLAGSDAGARALLRRLGIAQVESLATLIEALKILHVTGPLGGASVASMSCSGGEASLMADAGARHGVHFPNLETSQKADLKMALGPNVALANPLDYHTYVWGDGVTMGRAFTAMMQGNFDIGTLVVDFPRKDHCDPSAWDCVIEAARYVKGHTDIPFACLASLPENLEEDRAGDLMAAGIIPLCGLEESLAAIAACGAIGRGQDCPVLLEPHPVAESKTLNEAEAKDVLMPYGVVVPKRVFCDDIQAVGRAYDHIGGSVVLKGMGFAHKSDAGAVVLGLASKDQVLTAANAMGCTQFLVEEMVQGSVCELLLGVAHDPVHGFVMTLAAGGVLTEILQDAVSMILPVQESDVRSALAQLKVWPILKGYRGKPAADMEAIVSAALAVQGYVIDHQATLEEVEINPLLALPEGAIAVDALIRKGDENV